MKSYPLHTLADMLTVPADRIHAMLKDLGYALTFCHLVGGEGMAEAFNNFVWTDDGNQSVYLNKGDAENGLSLVVTGAEDHDTQP